MIFCMGGVRAFTSRGVCDIYHVNYFYFGRKLLLSPGVLLVSLFAVAIVGRPLLLVSCIRLAGLFENLTASIGVISWFIGVAMNLAGPIQYLV